MNTRHLSTVIFSLVFALFTTQSMAREDSDITNEIKQKLSANETLAPFNIDIITKDGVVNVKGVVDSDPQAGTMVEIAQATEGVNDVDTTSLKVKSSKHPLKDTYITAKVKGSFLRDKLFTDQDIEAFGIKVTTKNGIVYLSGKTNDQKEISNAIAIARAIKDVKDVKSTLVVKPMSE